jgi:hypothetical protein
MKENKTEIKTATFIALLAKHSGTEVWEKALAVRALGHHLAGNMKEIQKFADRLTANPQDAFYWSDSAQKAAAESGIIFQFYGRLSGMIDGGQLFAPTFYKCVQSMISELTEELLERGTPLGQNKEFRQPAAQAIRSLLVQIEKTLAK